MLGCGILFVVCGVASRSGVVMLCRVGWRWVVWRRVVVALRCVAACAVLFCSVALGGVLWCRALAVPCRIFCCFLLLVVLCSIALCCVVWCSCRWVAVSRVVCRYVCNAGFCCLPPCGTLLCVAVVLRGASQCVALCSVMSWWWYMVASGCSWCCFYVVCSGVRL